MSFSARGQRRKCCLQSFTSSASSARPKHRRRKPLAPCSYGEIVSRSVGHSLIGPWLSLVERLVRDEEAASSNLAGPTNTLYRGDNSRRGWNFSSTARREAPAVGTSSFCSGGVPAAGALSTVRTPSLLWVLSSRAWQYEVFLMMIGCRWERQSSFVFLPKVCRVERCGLCEERRSPRDKSGLLFSERFLFCLPGEAFLLPRAICYPQASEKNGGACIMTYSVGKRNEHP
jgi:hypothetical protein